MQVQKMEQTIEQDLSKAMAGLREQFRQQFDDQSDLSSLSGGRADQNNEPQAHAGNRSDEVDGLGELTVASDSRLSDTASELQSAAVMAEFRSEAAAARDEVLGGLARLRRDLEAERARQSQQSAHVIHRGASDGAAFGLAHSVGVEQERNQLQIAASEAVIVELRRDIMMQQASMTQLRRDLVTSQEQYQRALATIEQTMASFQEELLYARANVPPGQPGANQAEATLSQDILQDLKLLVARCEGLEQFTKNVAAATASKLEQFEGRLASELAEERTAITRSLGVVTEMEKRTQGFVAALEAASSKHSDEMKGVRAMCEELMHEQASGVVEAEGAEGKLREELRAELVAVRGEISTLADGLAAERLLRMQDVAELRLYGQASGDQTAATAGSSKMAEEQVTTVSKAAFNELLEEVARQVKDSGIALRGHFTVACAELRGELTARLDAYEVELKRVQAEPTPPRQDQVQLASRMDAAEAKLAEVFRITELLATSSKETTTAGAAPEMSMSQFTTALVDELAAREAAAASATQQATMNAEIDASGGEKMMPLISGDLKDSLERLVAKVKDISNPMTSAEALSYTNMVAPPQTAYGMHPARRMPSQATGSATAPPPLSSGATSPPQLLSAVGPPAALSEAPTRLMSAVSAGPTFSTATSVTTSEAPSRGRSAVMASLSGTSSATATSRGRAPAGAPPPANAVSAQSLHMVAPSPSYPMTGPTVAPPGASSASSSAGVLQVQLSSATAASSHAPGSPSPAQQRMISPIRYVRRGTSPVRPTAPMEPMKEWL